MNTYEILEDKSIRVTATCYINAENEKEALEKYEYGDYKPIDYTEDLNCTEDRHDIKISKAE